MTESFVAHTTNSMSIDKLNPKDALGFLCWKVARLYTNDLTARFAKAGVDVTVEQWRILIPLYKKDGLTQGQLCEILSQEKTGISRLVAALEKRGLIRREACPHDRRVKYLYITEAGRNLFDSTVDMVVVSRNGLEENIDPEELAICKKVLWQIIKPTLPPEHQCEMDED